MVIFVFQVIDKLGRVRFFQEIFLLANTSMEVILGMLFLSFSNADIQFTEKKLIWRSYTAKEAPLIIQRIELIDKKEFAKVALDENIETFVLHMSSLSLGSKMTIHLAWKPQIALLLAKEVTISAKYSDFTDVFLKKSAEVLPERTGINDYAIKLEDGKQPLNGSIYSLGPVEPETLKTYIETNLANYFIRPSMFLAGAPILFVCKPNDSLQLCVNYQGLNNLTIKNPYRLPLIGKSLNWLGWVKRFIYLDLTGVYHWMRIKEHNKWKTAFRTRYGHFKYQVILFQLLNAPASFQDYIKKILAEKLDVFVIVYLNNILTYTKNADQAHVNAVQWVLNKLRKHRLFANLKKCRFHKDGIWFLGYVVSSQGVKIEDEQIKMVKN